MGTYAVHFPDFNDRHHRLSRHHGGQGGDNVLTVNRGEHMAYHWLFNNLRGIPYTPEEVAEKIGVIYAGMKALFCGRNGEYLSFQNALNRANLRWRGHGFVFYVSRDHRKINPETFKGM